MNHDSYDPGELIMPFIIVRSVGGPYDDDAFAAGWALGVLDTQLADRQHPTLTKLVVSDLLPQIDLIAMRYQYTVETLADLDGWHTITLTRTRTDNDEVTT